MNLFTKYTSGLLSIGIAVALASCSALVSIPENPSPNVTILIDDITEDMTLTKANSPYLLSGVVSVYEGVTLAIEPGVVIFADTCNSERNETCSALCIERGAQLDAEGTRELPIIFSSILDGDLMDSVLSVSTSDNAFFDDTLALWYENARAAAPGDWGGMVICGAAPNNIGPNEIPEIDCGNYGGSDPTDNSGVYKYIVLKYGGAQLSNGNQFNGFSFYSVGSETEVDYIEAYKCQDDGIEFFGGTVDVKHAVSVGCGDEMFDWTDGWRGKGQFWLGVQTGGIGQRGLEADNREDGDTIRPLSNPTIYNMTLIGEDSNSEGIVLRRGTAGSIFNSIIAGFETGVDIDGDLTHNWANSATDTYCGASVTALTDILSIEHTILYENDDEYSSDNDDFDEGFWFQEQIKNNYEADTDNPPLDEYISTGSAIDGTVSTCVPPENGFFDVSATFNGAVRASNDWTNGWVVW